MKKNSALSDIQKALEEARQILILPHAKADGDALGSASALVETLRHSGKNVFAWVAEEPPVSLKTLCHEGVVIELPERFSPDLLIAIDCADTGRFVDRSKFYPGIRLLNIDHHRTNTHFGDLVHVCEDFSSAAEIVYTLFESLGYQLTQESCRFLLGGILLDTNRFYYSSTKVRTLEIAARMIERGVDMAQLNEEIFGQQPIEKMRLLAMAIDHAEFFSEGRGVRCWLSKEMQCKAGTDNTDDIVEALRDIQGVELSLLLYEYRGTLRASLRSFGSLDVSEIATSLGGGGHKNAAGITFGPIDPQDALDTLMPLLEALLAGKN